MKLINQRPTDESLGRTNRKFEAELLREMRMENTQRSVFGYGLFALLAFNNMFTLVLVLLLGLGVIALPDKVILTLIGETVAYDAGMFFTIIKRLFVGKK